MRLGATVPDFRAETTGGSLNWHEYIEGHWSVLFSHPADFTPVCTTELGSVASLQSEFDKRGVKIAALSCNDTESHKAWVKDIEHLMFHDGKEGSVSYPIISDPKREIAVLYGMLDPEEKVGNSTHYRSFVCFCSKCFPLSTLTSVFLVVLVFDFLRMRKVCQ
jgi:1-Cys peroxiredoxin 6